MTSRIAGSTDFSSAVATIFMIDLHSPAGSAGLFGGHQRAGERVGWRPPHPPRPLGIKMSHADLVVDGIVFAAPVQDVPWRRARAHAHPLAGDTQEILVQISPERSPDGVVVADPLRLLVRGIALEAEAAELDHDPVGTDRRHGVDAE